MCLILAGSSSLTSLVREAATKRSLRPRQPIRAGEKIAQGEHEPPRSRVSCADGKSRSLMSEPFFKGTKYRGLTDGGVEATSGRI